MWIDTGLRRVLMAPLAIVAIGIVSQKFQAIVALLLGILLFLVIAKLACPHADSKTDRSVMPVDEVHATNLRPLLYCQHLSSS